MRLVSCIETDNVSFESAGLHMRRPNHKHKITLNKRKFVSLARRKFEQNALMIRNVTSSGLPRSLLVF